MGRVYLVGAGPGDPKLLTLRAVEVLRLADVLVYDALVHPEVLEHAGEGAERYFVGKRAGTRSMRQEAICELLVELAGRHEVVARVKGGDPFVFGRGGEEALALARAGVEFEVVPGITAGVAGPAYAGIPVTHRGVSSTVTFATGHEDPHKGGSSVAWERLADPGGTLVFYMGVRRLAENLEKLRAAGRSPDTPAAVIERATYGAQRTLVGTLATLASQAEAAGVRAPALVVVGEVVRLHHELHWFDRRPLYGRRILVTRARAQASAFAGRLAELGAEVVQFPTIRIVPPADPGPLERAAREVGGYDWLILTSVNAVERFWAALRAAGRDTRALAGVSLCAIGPATAAAIELEGARPELIPDRYVSEAVAAAMDAAGDLSRARVLLPRADIARDALPRLLRERGAEVVEVEAYRTVPDDARADEMRALLRQGEVDLVTFTSSSTVRNLVELAGTELGSARVASIGPITTQTARELGLEVEIEAEDSTIEGLVAAIRTYYEGGGA